MGKVIKAVTSIFSKPKLPSMPKAIALPDPTGPSAAAALRAKAIETSKRGKRGDILTNKTQGGVYSSTNLGGTV